MGFVLGLGFFGEGDFCLFIFKYSVLLCLRSLYLLALGTVAGIMKVVNAVNDACCQSKTQSSEEL